jgi:hypothetical protein
MVVHAKILVQVLLDIFGPEEDRASYAVERQNPLRHVDLNRTRGFVKKCGDILFGPKGLSNPGLGSRAANFRCVQIHALVLH